MILVKWHLIRSNFMGQIGFQLLNALLLVTILHKIASYRITEYNQTWFGNIWVQHYEVLVNEIWQKEFKIGPHKLSNIC